MSVTTQVERISYLARHLREFLPYVTPRKAINAVLNLVETRRKVPSPKSFPPYLKIEPTPLCHLACLGCRHRLAEFNRELRPSMNLTLEAFKKIVDPLAPTTLGISLSFRGEPLLNRELPRMAAYAHAKGIATSFPTSLSLNLSEQMAEDLVLSGLDAMYISLDGASEATYSRYRIGGRFDKVLANVRLLADTKRRLNSNHPRLVWKMVVFDYNRHELPIQRQRYREWGFDAIEQVPDNKGEEFRQKTQASRQHMIAAESPCFWIWNTMVIDCEGEVSPCCTYDKFGIGNALQQDSRAVWRCQPYRALRAAFGKSGYGKELHPVCRDCLGMGD